MVLVWKGIRWSGKEEEDNYPFDYSRHYCSYKKYPGCIHLFNRISVTLDMPKNVQYYPRKYKRVFIGT